MAPGGDPDGGRPPPPRDSRRGCWREPPSSVYCRREGGEEVENLSADIELAIARAENLMSRRTLLLNYVLLQQNQTMSVNG